MKKKFLALALAAAVMAPTTSAFAQTNNTQTIGNTGVNAGSEKYEADVTVSGEVRTADGSAAAGKIEVELPVATTFLVDEKGDFSSPAFDVTNRGGSDVKLMFSSFTVNNNNGGITLAPNLTEGDRGTYTRAQVRLGLESVINGTSEGFELLESQGETELGTIKANGGNAKIKIHGLAGNKQEQTVDDNGATGDFTVRFKIQKVTS